MIKLGGRLEEALTQYKRSKANGVDRAEIHIRNVRFQTIWRYCQLIHSQVSAKLLGQKMKAASASAKPESDSEHARP